MPSVPGAKQGPMNRRSILLCSGAVAVGLIFAGCASTNRPGAASPNASRPAASAPATTVAGRLEAPKATATEDDAYFRDLAIVDQSLTTYVGSEQGVALRALLTDGAAFCAFLNRGGGIDNAMESVVIGANSVEAQTHLPRNVATFNAIDATALIALCPGEQRLIPKTDLQHIEELAQVLAKSPQHAVSGPG
jgi:hypothetical protein